MCFIYIIYAYLLYQVSNLPNLVLQEMARMFAESQSKSGNLIQAHTRPRNLLLWKQTQSCSGIWILHPGPISSSLGKNPISFNSLFQRHVTLPVQVLFLLELFIKRKRWEKELKLKSNFQVVSPQTPSSPSLKPIPDVASIWPESKVCHPGRLSQLSLPHPGQCWGKSEEEYDAPEK